MANFLNTDGLSALWAKIKSKFYTKTEVDALIPEDEIMVVSISWDDANQKYVADKTAQEIAAFVNNGGVAVVNSNDSNSMLLCNTVISDVTENYYYAGFYYAAIEDVEGGTLTYGGRITIKHENGIESVEIAQGNNSIPSPAGNSDGVPIMDGTASRGDSINYARADHVHPSDTSKVNVADVLSKTNTTSYTPTADYNPATKKYVDDTIPTKTSDLTNDSLFLSGSARSSSYANGYILIGTKNNSSVTLAETLKVSSTTTGNASQTLTVGRSHADDGFKGEILLSNRPSNGGYTTITPTANSAITLSLPSASGTLALTTDISTTLSGLTDTNISNPENGQVLSYDATNEVWVNANSTDNIFLITATYAYNSSTEEYDYSVDKTYNEIVEARNAGKICLVKQGSRYYYYKDEDNSTLLFVSFYKITYHNKYEIYNLTITSANNVNAYNFEIPQEISDLNNVSASSPYSGQSLIYNSTNQRWQNGYIPLTNLSDTTISSPTNGQVLSYDSTTSKWINTNALTETRVNELIAAALAQYGDGDTATYGYTDASEVNY